MEYQNVSDDDQPTPAIEERDASYAPNRFLELKPLRRVWDEFQFIYREWPDNLHA